MDKYDFHIVMQRSFFFPIEFLSFPSPAHKSLLVYVVYNNLEAGCRNCWRGKGRGAAGSLVFTSSSQRGADKGSDQMAATACIRDSFNRYICELEQEGDLGCQYWQTVTGVILTGGERLLFHEIAEQ